MGQRDKHLYDADLLGFHSHVALKPGIQTTFDGLGVALQRSLSPSDIAGFVCDLDEQPPRRDAEVLHGRYLTHLKSKLLAGNLNEGGTRLGGKWAEECRSVRIRTTSGPRVSHIRDETALVDVVIQYKSAGSYRRLTLGIRQQRRSPQRRRPGVQEPRTNCRDADLGPRGIICRICGATFTRYRGQQQTYLHTYVSSSLFPSTTAVTWSGLVWY